MFAVNSVYPHEVCQPVIFFLEDIPALVIIQLNSIFKFDFFAEPQEWKKEKKPINWRFLTQIHNFYTFFIPLLAAIFNLLCVIYLIYMKSRRSKAVFRTNCSHARLREREKEQINDQLVV